MGYRQLTQKQRYQIFARLETGASQRQIARELDVHSTISREIRRNAVCLEYDPEQAQTLSDRRRRLAWKTTKRLPSLVRWITRQLRDEWSPEQISGFMANANGIRVSHEWIYSLIRDDKVRGGNLWNALRLPQRRCYHRHLASSASTALAIKSRAPWRSNSWSGSVTWGSGCERARWVESVMAYPLVLVEILVVINQQDTPPFLPTPILQESP
ncbi:hypothetical protein BTW10_02635 [Chromohalobacter japonicus]|uniref:Transposase IS30-like HTH domain-containing protein n=1 Tax=Chromohalobacter japonicus TaxID=223900 RepID=A0A1Q8TFI5_9GAMM|nr:hypothetical protein BTW10_02635 [Chromohalobacter japonicus]